MKKEKAGFSLFAVDVFPIAALSRGNFTRERRVRAKAASPPFLPRFLTLRSIAQRVRCLRLVDRNWTKERAQHGAGEETPGINQSLFLR